MGRVVLGGAENIHSEPVDATVCRLLVSYLSWVVLPHRVGVLTLKDAPWRVILLIHPQSYPQDL